MSQEKDDTVPGQLEDIRTELRFGAMRMDSIVRICNGGTADPLLVAAPTVADPSTAVQSGSPLRSAGRNTAKALRDVLWCQRDTSPDIGAHEFGGTPCLTIRAPVELR